MRLSCAGVNHRVDDISVFVTFERTDSDEMLNTLRCLLGVKVTLCLYRFYEFPVPSKAKL